jgi:hypothetical protein
MAPLERLLGEGEVLGWSWLLPPYQWHYSARAIEPTEAIALDGVALRGLCEQDHDLGSLAAPVSSQEPDLGPWGGWIRARGA